LVAVLAIAGWLVLWGVAVAIGLPVGKRVVGPDGLEGYGAMTGITGVWGVTPAVLVAAFFLLLVKGRIVWFFVSGVLTGLAITLWPVVLWLLPR
jgi:hypothetical protein